MLEHMLPDFVTGVPFSGCEEQIPPDCRPIVATREDEACAIACGAYLVGKRPLVYMQNSGLGNSIDALTSLIVPYGIDIEIVISNRTSPEHHFLMGSITKSIMEKIYDKVRYCS